MADIQFRFLNTFGQPVVDINGDFERGTLNGTVDGWEEYLNPGGTTGTIKQINSPVYWNNRSLLYAHSQILTGSFNARFSNILTLNAGTYRIIGWAQTQDASIRKLCAGLRNTSDTADIIISNIGSTFQSGTHWQGFVTGSLVTSSGGLCRTWLGFGISASGGGTTYFDRLGIYKQGRGTIDYTLDLQDMPNYPDAPQVVFKQLVKESYYGRSWIYPIYRKRQWIMNFQEVSETCKNNFEGLIWQGDDVFFFDNIQNVGGTFGGTFIIRIDPDSFKPETPAYGLWNFQIILNEVEGVGF